jgi:hypothetical protein
VGEIFVCLSFGSAAREARDDVMVTASAYSPETECDRRRASRRPAAERRRVRT